MIGRVVLIAGPTASGKSAVAMALAKAVGGAVINADSMQVYRDLRVVTARPSPADEACVPHNLYGHIDGGTAYSAGQYARDVSQLLDDLRARSQPAIIVGGTGLYLKALTDGLSPMPEIDPAIRAHWRAEAETLEAGALAALLRRRDPEMAGRLVPTDLQRICRALEVLDETGVSLADWQRRPRVPVIPDGAFVGFRLDWADRQRLYDRADRRFVEMMAAGALSEVAHLAKRQLIHELPIMRALGVSQLLALAVGAVDEATAVAAAQQDTRRFIKRQQTWLKHQNSEFKTIKITENMFDVAKYVKFIQQAVDE